MNKKQITEAITRTYSRAKFSLIKHSPAIFMTAGIVGIVGSVVLACKATTKLEGILRETQERLDCDRYFKKQGVSEFDQKDDTKTYSKDDAKKDKAIIYTQTCAKIIRIYSPAFVLGLLSIGSIITSSYILKRNNLALAAAYAAVDRSFKKYREAVIERFGEDVDRELRYGIKTVEVTETVTDEDGNEKEVVTTKKVFPDDVLEHGPYAKFFDEFSLYWKKDADYNLMFLQAQENYANDKLAAEKFLFLNEVYDMLDIPRTKAGQVVGWVYDPDDPLKSRVDFGIYDPRNKDFVNGYERSILLDFNVQGDILNLME